MFSTEMSLLSFITCGRLMLSLSWVNSLQCVLSLKRLVYQVYNAAFVESILKLNKKLYLETLPLSESESFLSH